MYKVQSTVLQSTLLAIALATGVHAQDKPQYVVQTDLATGTYVYIDVNGPEGVGEVNGSFVALLPISEAGSRFELFAKGTPPDEKLYSLYEIPVGSYPTVQLKTWSDDPYATVTRTRADMPFQVQMEVTNIDPNSTVKGKRMLYFEKLVSEYAPDASRTSIDGNPDYTVVEYFYFDQNETFRAHLTGTEANITGPASDKLKLDLVRSKDPTYPYNFGDAGEFSDLSPTNTFKEKGEEYYRIYAWLSDELGWGRIAEQKVQIWPIADGEINAIVGGVRYENFEGMTFNAIPTLEMTVRDLYPTSQTKMRIYKGPYQSGIVSGEQQLIETIIAKDYEPVNFNTTVPQTATQQITPDQWDSADLEDGQYTVEISTKTPLKGDKSEIMTYSTFNLKRTITINGNSTTSGK